MQLKTKSVYTVNSEQETSKTSKTIKKWWMIDKDMVRFKFHFFLFTGALGSAIPFLPIIAKNKVKLSATSFAAVLLFMQFFTAAAKPVIGFLTDYFNKLKVVLCLLAIGEAVFLFLLLLVPPIPKLKKFESENLIELSIDSVSLCNFTKSNLKKASDFAISSSDMFYLDFDVSDNTYPQTEEFSEYLQNYVLVQIQHDCHTSESNSTIAEQEDTPDQTTNLFPNNATSYNVSWFPSLSCTKTYKKEFLVSIDNCIIHCNRRTDCRIPIIPSGESIVHEVPKAKHDFDTYQFWVFVLIFIILSTCKNAMFTLSDTACCESIEKSGAEYGKQRLFGAVGWGLLAAISGVLSDHTNSYIAPWGISALLTAIMLWNISRLELVKPQKSNALLKDIKNVLASKNFLLFELGAVINGIGWGFVDFYLSWFVVSIGGNRLICGLVEAVQCFAGEIPFMFFSTWILTKIGHFNTTTLALLANCVRFLWYSQVRNPWMVLPVEWLHGISYGVFYTSMASFAKMSSTPGTETTTQSVIFSTYEGIGSGIGNIIAGLGFDYIGSRKTFLYAGIFFGCCAASNIFLTFIVLNNNICKNKKSQK
ncbi:major facilitator superfamily domain-containing protein 6 [Trichonephila clavata]|uniref:Major facilitator superfamily domain-containing protein 6 n=1 Tax=Trichonephila clavata TaxID=2740835 RepID=A0A8X6G077_TRICU|nr:major facilitator superfamily domain-containing protein 6 [Trichonephila clavata]